MLNTKQEKILLLTIIVVSVFTLFFKLGDRSLENNDRILYAEVAREMTQSWDWVVLRHSGKIYLNKPPLVFWLMAIPSYIYGTVTPFTARLPSAVSALLGIVVIFFFGKQIYRSALAGFLSSLILLSCYEYSWRARVAQIDMPLCFFIVLSLFFFHTSYIAQKEWKKLLYFLLFCASVGLAVMAKGPTGFLIPVLTTIAFLAYKKDFKTFCKPPYLSGIVVLIFVIFPWPALLCSKLEGSANVLKELQNARIFTHKEAFYFYLIEVPKRFFPWSVFLPAIIFYLFSRTHTHDIPQSGRRDDRFFPLIWFGTMLIILSIPKCKDARYMLPAYPALALMVGGMWECGLRNANCGIKKFSSRHVGMTWFWHSKFRIPHLPWLNPSIIASLIILLAALITAPVFFWFKYQYLFTITICTSIIFLCAIVLLYYYKKVKINQWSFAVITAFYILAQVIHVHTLSIEDVHHSPGRELVRSVSTYVEDNELLAYYNLPGKYVEPLNFYMNRVVPELKKQEEIYRALASNKQIYLIMQIADYQSLDGDLKAMAKLNKEVFYKNEALMLISNKLEATRNGY